MASVPALQSIVGATCTQLYSSHRDAHDYDPLALLPNFGRRRCVCPGGRIGNICATRCCSHPRVALRTTVSTWQQSCCSGIARGWRELSRAHRGRKTLPKQDLSRFGIAGDNHKYRAPVSRVGTHGVFASADDFEYVCGLSTEFAGLEGICTPLAALRTSCIATTQGLDDLFTGDPRGFWFVHVFSSGLLPTLVGWQLLQYSSLLPETSYTSLDIGRKVYRSLKGHVGNQQSDARVTTLPAVNLKKLQRLRCDHSTSKLSLCLLKVLLALQCLSREASFRSGAVLVLCKRWLADRANVLTLHALNEPKLASIPKTLQSGGVRSWVWLCNLQFPHWLAECKFRATQSPSLNSSRQTSLAQSINLQALQGCRTFFVTQRLSRLLYRRSLTPQVSASELLVAANTDDMGFVSWFNRMKKTYGASFMGLLVMGYWIQGFRSFPWLAVSFLFKDGLQVDPATMQFVLSSASLPMVAKPIYGILSDAFYIGGSHRVPYLIIAASLQVLSWGAIIAHPGATSSLGVLTVLLALSNMGAAIAEVMNDALVAEAGKKGQNSAGELQSLAWTALATGGVLGSLCGGLAMRRMDCHTMFSIFLVMVTAQLLVCCTISERSFGLGGLGVLDVAGASSTTSRKTFMSLISKALRFLPNLQRKSDITIGKVENVEDSARLVGEEDAAESSSEKLGDRNVEGSERLALQAAGGVKDQGDDCVDSSVSNCELSRLGKVDALDRPSAFGMMAQQYTMLVELVRKPAIMRPVLWFVASYAMIPALGSSLFFFQTQQLHIDPAYLGLQKVVGQLGLMGGSVLFNRYLKQLPLRRVVGCVQGLLGFCMLSDFLLVTRVNLLLGIKDELFVLGVSAFVEAIAQFKVLPFLVLLAQLCPAGSEGSLFAFFMSAHCLANTFSAYLGVALASHLQISANSFTYLPLGIFIQAMAALVPITLIGLIPEESKAPIRQSKVEKKVP